MRVILSREDYINCAAQLVHSSDAKNLLDFTLHTLRHGSYLSKMGPSITEMMQRARQFMLEVISKIHAVPLSNAPHDPDCYTLPLLLHTLKVR